MKYRRFFIGIILHILLSSVLFGAVIVYQKSYNTTHLEPIQMADVTLQETHADIQILHYHFPFQLPAENSFFYYVTYLLTDTPFHEWTAIFDFIKN